MSIIVGIDPSTVKLAVVTYRGDKVQQYTYPRPKRDRDGTRYAEAYNHIRSLLYDLVKPGGELGRRVPVYVFLEYPI